MNDTKKEQFIELRAKGLSYDAISEELNVSMDTLITWSKDFEIEIDNSKAMHLDALREKYCVSINNRIKLLGEYLNKINAKIDLRIEELNDVPILKLFELQLKYTSDLKKEEDEIFFNKRDDFPLTNEISSYKVSWKA